MEHEFDYEKSFARLEAILEKMNSGKVTLDESLKLYEEADTLLRSCSSKLQLAETKIEMLMQRREKENAPLMEAFALKQ